MKISFHKNLNKQLDKLPAAIKTKVRERIKLFMIHPFNRQLNNHPLKGKYFNYRSINIRGNIRAIYKHLDEDEYIFVALGTHNQLYS